MTDYTDEAIDAAVAEATKPAFRVELEHAIWALVDGGMTLSEITWEVKKLAVEVAKNQRVTKADAAKSLSISPQTLWNIENDNHK